MKVVRALVRSVAVVIVTASMVSPLNAQGNGGNKPVVSSAASDAAQTTLFVNGSGFSASALVYLGGVPLGGVFIASGGTQLIASLPAGLLPGSYRLTIAQGNNSGTFDLTLGSTGAAGPPGPIGPPGPAGPAGLDGAAGPAGPAGANGAAGPAGPVGPVGPEGPAGPVGAVGPEGPIGPMGPQGPQGVQGPPGFDGAQGPQGPQGMQGPAGMNGPVGPTGPMGVQGAQGAQGPVGPVGPTGAAGAVATAFQAGFGLTTVPSGSSSDVQFVALPATVTITAGQKIFVTSTATLGAGGVAAGQLGLYVCHKLSTATDPSTFGGGTLGLSTPANTRNHYSLSAVITGLAPGVYSVGLCGYTSEGTSHWTNNEWGYTSALVLQ